MKKAMKLLYPIHGHLMTKHVIFGAPGTGKTTYLINTIRKLFNEGYKPEEICFCTFQKSAAEDVKIRMIKEFDISKERMPYFGTIHSLCYRQSSMGYTKLITLNQLELFFESKGLKFSPEAVDEDVFVSELEDEANLILSFYNLFRITFCIDIYQVKDLTDLKRYFNKLKVGDLFNKLFVGRFDTYDIIKDYEDYKKGNDFIDFTDMLLRTYNSKWVVPTKILIVDEAQDLSTIQWGLYDNWKTNKERVYLAGDDDQSIFSWNGSKPDRLLKEKDTADELEILHTTYRLPSVIQDYATKFISMISSDKRVVKKVKPLKTGGSIEHLEGHFSLFPSRSIRRDKRTFILFRTNYYKKQFVSSVLFEAGIPYYEIRGKSFWNNRTINLFNALVKLDAGKRISYTELEYLIDSVNTKFKVLERGAKTNFTQKERKENYDYEDLMKIGFKFEVFSYFKDFKLLSILKVDRKIEEAFSKWPRQIINPFDIKLFVGTYHASKGLECDDSYVFTDCSRRVSKAAGESREDWDNEIRAHYVARTRSKERLILINHAFPMSEVLF